MAETPEDRQRRIRAEQTAQMAEAHARGRQIRFPFGSVPGAAAPTGGDIALSPQQARAVLALASLDNADEPDETEVAREAEFYASTRPSSTPPSVTSASSPRRPAARRISAVPAESVDVYAQTERSLGSPPEVSPDRELPTVAGDDVALTPAGRSAVSSGSGGPSLLARIAQAYFQRERARLGIPAEEQAATESADISLLRRAQAARIAQEREFAPADRDLRTRLTEAEIRNLDEPNRAPLGPGTPAYKTDVRGNVTAIVPQPSGEFTQTSLGVIDTPQREPREPQPPRGFWQPQYDQTGTLLGYYNAAQDQFRAAGEGNLPSGTRPTAPTAGERTDMALVRQAKIPVSTMRTALEAVRAAEVKSPVSPGTMTGPIAGRLGEQYRKRISTAGPGGDFDMARARMRTIVYGLSGKQLNETELRWLDTILPRLSDPGVDEQINRFESFVDSIIRARQQGFADPFAFAASEYQGGGSAPTDPPAPSGTGGFRVIGVRP